MAGKIFVNYRRGDDPNGAARVRDGLAARFGKSSIFMDVDNLLPGQRFDEELANALTQCDVLVAVVGTRWVELLKAREASGEPDYVRQEIAEALRRKLLVIPVRVGREGSMPPLPRINDLPPDIRNVVFYQKLDLAHERFGRDIEDLANAIRTIRAKHGRVAPRVSWRWISPIVGCALVTGVFGAHYAGLDLPGLGSPKVAAIRSNDGAKDGKARPDEGEQQSNSGFIPEIDTAGEGARSASIPPGVFYKGVASDQSLRYSGALVGLLVYDRAGTVLGRITSIIEGPEKRMVGYLVTFRAQGVEKTVGLRANFSVVTFRKDGAMELNIDNSLAVFGALPQYNAQPR